MWFPSWLRNAMTGCNLTRTRPTRRKSAAKPRRTCLLLEVLEDRTVPTVGVGLGGHTLSIVDPDVSGHTINVNQTAVQGQFTVQVDAGPLLTFNGVAKINADLGADSDLLNFNSNGFSTNLSGNLTITAGDGNNTVNDDLNAIGGNLSVTEGNGADVLEFSANVGGNVSVTQGGNNDVVLIATGATSILTISGNLSVTQGNGSYDDVLIEVPALTVAGNFSVTQGVASDQLSFLTLRICGNFSVTQHGGDAVILTEFAPNDSDSSVTVAGNFTMTQDGGGVVQVFELSVSGNLSVTQGAGVDSNVWLTYSAIGGNLSVTQGDGPAPFVQVYTATPGVGTIGGNVSVTQGDGEQATLLMSGSVGGRVSVKQGDGAQDGVGVFGLASIGGNLSVIQGDGVQDQVFLGFNGAGPVTVGGNLSLAQGNGATDLVDFDDTSVAGKTAISVGSGGGDEVDIEGGADVANGLGVQFSGNVSIRFGNSGTDTLSIGTDGDAVVFAAKASFSANSPGNTYVQGPFASFPAGQPTLHNL